MAQLSNGVALKETIRKIGGSVAPRTFSEWLLDSRPSRLRRSGSSSASTFANILPHLWCWFGRCRELVGGSSKLPVGSYAV